MGMKSPLLESVLPSNIELSGANPNLVGHNASSGNQKKKSLLSNKKSEIYLFYP